MSKKRILYIFGSSREEVAAGVAAGVESDTSLYGMNHLPHETVHLSNSPILSVQCIKNVREILRADVVISSVAIPTMFLISLIRWKYPRWIILNINLSQTLMRLNNNKFRRRLLIHMLARSHAIICLSSAQKKILIECGILEEKLHLVLFGVDKNPPVPPTSGKSDYILSVGKDKARDYETFFEAVKGLGRRVIIVASKRNFSLDTSGYDNVQILFDIDHSKLFSFYQDAKLVVVPLHDDNFHDGSDCSGQTVVLEAMSLSKPVIVTRRNWITDYVEPGRDAVVVERAGAAELRDTIKKCWADPAYLDAVGKNGRKVVDEKCSTELMGHKISSLIESLE